MSYDVVIIGAGVAGASLAAALGRCGRSVALVERDLRDPNHLFVGELLQPGGCAALETLGLESCVLGIDAQATKGFAVIHGEKRHALEYPQNKYSRGKGQDEISRVVQGVAFRHGKFVGRLREAARAEGRVDVIEGTVVALDEQFGRVDGVTYRDRKAVERQLKAKLVIACDGRNSRLRRQLGYTDPERLSYSVGVLVKNAELPCPGYGHVFVVRPAPLLGYRISSDEVRVLVDVPGRLPGTRNGELAQWLTEVVSPQLPAALRSGFDEAARGNTLHAMPTYSLTGRTLRRPGVVMLGDALNMRHPITGSGMTVALNDVRLLAELLSQVALEDPVAVDRCVSGFYRERRALSMTVDMLSGALYDVFRAERPGLESMRDAMLRYWELGGPAAEGPMALLSGLAPRPALLLLHYTAVALVGVGTNVLPRGSSIKDISPNLPQASRLVAAAFQTMRPQVRRALAMRA